MKDFEILIGPRPNPGSESAWYEPMAMYALETSYLSEQANCYIYIFR